MDSLLVINAGSSSVKFQLFGADGSRDLQRLVKGQIEGIGTHPRLRVTAVGREPVDEIYAPERVADVPAAFAIMTDWLRKIQNVEPIAVGHRVVHGGPKYKGPVLVDAAVLSELKRYMPLAPLHQANNLALIQSIRAQFPNLPQVACFDTAFHRGHDAVVDHFAMPARFYAEGVQRYGFHGLSYEFIARRLCHVAPETAGGRVVIAHLGSGASMCALLAGRSIETTMGFTPLDGLPMGTRPGQIDPGVLLYLFEEKRMSVTEIKQLLYDECGLKGLSGISSDVQELEASLEPRARFALDYFVYRVGLCTGMLAAALGGLDAFVFTAGIGENSPSLRARIVDKLAWLGAQIDPNANARGEAVISGRESRVGLYVIPTDEERMIADHTLALLTAAGLAAR